MLMIPQKSFGRLPFPSAYHGCLFYRLRAVIPAKLQSSVLSLLHQGHFGVQKMKQLSCTAVYWPNIDQDIADLCRKCTTCAIHQNAPPKAALHPWMLPEKPWSRLHLDHAINFMGHNWLVMVEAYSKYPCIHPNQSISVKTTMNLLAQDFAHFGYPHTLVTDNAPTFMLDEFQDYCQARGFLHLTGAPYHPAGNGAAERLVQTFRQSLRKSDKAPRDVLFEFLIQYRRTPTAVQFSLFMHPDQAQNTLSGVQGQEATAVAVIYFTAPTSSRKTTKYK